MDKRQQKKIERRSKIRRRIRSTIKGTAERPRLSVFKSNKYTYLQLVNDLDGVTLAASQAETGVDNAKKAGSELAKLAQDKGINKVVFDRSGYKYHGIVKAAAEGARDGGLDF
ncbi:MAG: 50S ribosomal protein L18 [Gracilimonas sp.]|uniref:50S ribosomal protein L18 n=1 Tax=Gracilimonas TaxID=649462 RepID=UPI001B15A2D4|nr:50S ribosomal protein L18 [Gracilimonas sp.]MBO6587451.1 50S ribosomal protein L18 [Gracilimonas sp.]MBO6617085.1 50S ribosomal protein L18 [Gracilimonas sp.]